MILYEALEFVRKELDAYLKQEQSGDDQAVLASVVAPDGSVPTPDGKVVLSLISIEREAAASGATFYTRAENGDVSKRAPTLNLNLHVLVAGNHQDHREALKLLSNAIGFFQARPVFSAEDVPPVASGSAMAFPRGLQRLTFEVFNLALQDMSHLWGALGAKYQPSIIYKVRMITFQEAWLTETRPAITGGEPTLRS